MRSGLETKGYRKRKNPKNWQSFLRDNTNKTELFNFLTEKIVKLCKTNIVFVTKGETVVA